MQIQVANSVEEAKSHLADRPADCIIVAPEPDANAALERLNELVQDGTLGHTPVIVYPAHDTLLEESQFQRLDQKIAIKLVQSAERLLDQAAWYMHLNLSHLAESKRQRLSRLHSSEAVLAGKKVLVVDDDVRNIFALTSVLEREQMTVLSAETGKTAIEILQKTPNVDIVLMDIMMPEMDGNDTMRAIRRIPRFRTLPIIAITAKAMKGDREKCIEAGAWDYLSKPVETEQMLSVLRAWLYR